MFTWLAQFMPCFFLKLTLSLLHVYERAGWLACRDLGSSNQVSLLHIDRPQESQMNQLLTFSLSISAASGGAVNTMAPSVTTGHPPTQSNQRK